MPQREHRTEARSRAGRLEPIAVGLQVDVAEDQVRMTRLAKRAQLCREHRRVLAGPRDGRLPAPAEQGHLRLHKLARQCMRFAEAVGIEHRQEGTHVETGFVRAQQREARVLAGAPADGGFETVHRGQSSMPRCAGTPALK